MKHLDDESTELMRQSNILRQAEIIDEIELILLSAASVSERPGMQDYASGLDN